VSAEATGAGGIRTWRRAADERDLKALSPPGDSIALNLLRRALQSRSSLPV